MTKILERYIGFTILQATGLATLVITSILFLITLLKELKNIGVGEYDIVQAFLYILMRLPSALYQFSSMLILMGSIMGLSALSSRYELAVMRASGFSIRRIIVTVLGAAFLLIMLISMMGELLAPTLSYQAEIRKENAINSGQAVVTATGVWFHTNNNFIHVKHVVDRQFLSGVTRYQFDQQHHLIAAYYAKSLEFTSGHWQMGSVQETIFANDHTKSFYYPSLKWDIKFNANLLNVGLVDPSEMSLSKLNKFSRYLKQNNLQATEYQFELWHRILQPLASLIMIFLAVPFVLATKNSTTLGWRVLIGVMLGFTFYVLNAFFGQLCVVYQLSPIFAATFPPLMFAVLGLFLSYIVIKR